MHNCSNLCCCSQVQRCQVAHYFQRAIISQGAASSSALLQWKIKPTSKQHVVCICHIFCDILWHFMTVFIILQINVFDGGQCTRGKVSLISCVSQGLKKSIWGKASLGATWYQCGLKGAGPKFGQDGDDDSIENLTNNYDSAYLYPSAGAKIEYLKAVCSPMASAFACFCHSRWSIFFRKSEFHSAHKFLPTFL